MQNRGNPPPQYPIESVDRALRLLGMFGEHRELRLSDVRDRLEVGQSTAHRLMAMLVYHDFATQDPVSRVYRPGPALVEIGLRAVTHIDIRTVARPHLERLAEGSQETVHLGLLEGREVRFVDCIESGAALRVAGRVGRSLPAHATSIGKAALATLTDDDVRRLYPRQSLPAITAHTMRRRSQLLSELARIRERGWSRNSEESEWGVCSVGVAIPRVPRMPQAAVSIAAPISRFTDERAVELAGLAMAECRRISEHMAELNSG